MTMVVVMSQRDPGRASSFYTAIPNTLTGYDFGV